MTMFPRKTNFYCELKKIIDRLEVTTPTPTPTPTWAASTKQFIFFKLKQQKSFVLTNSEKFDSLRPQIIFVSFLVFMVGEEKSKANFAEKFGRLRMCQLLAVSTFDGILTCQTLKRSKLILTTKPNFLT